MPPAVAPTGPSAIEPAPIEPWPARFHDPALERDFRLQGLADQRLRTLILVGAVILAATLNLVTELSRYLDGEHHLAAIIAVRIVVFLTGAGMVAFIARLQSPRILDRTLTIYGLVLVGVTVGMMATHPGVGLMGPTTIVGGVALIYFFAPLPYLRILLLSAVMSVGGWVGWSLLRTPQPAGDDAFRLFIWLLLVNLVGLVGVNAAQRNVRALFWQRRRLEAAADALSRQATLLEQAVQREQATLRQYRQFAALIAHEFRNPLAIVKGKAQLLQLATQVDALPDADALPAIERAVDRLDSLFNQWLASDRLEEGEFPLRLEPLPLARLMRQVQETALHSPAHPLQFDAVAPQLHVDGDETLLRLAVLNLIDNAIKYSPAGGPIHLAVSAEAARATITVRDHGIGIAREHLERIFEKNFRVRPESTIPGSGLGLFLVRRIADLHHGAIAVDSVPGVGSRFRLSLPLSSAGR
ncbi:hypothetical protein STVA_25190 [Allostella vacuolata]|nr:hypothetical protein STVA_25190 [Stella vacuolata]